MRPVFVHLPVIRAVSRLLAGGERSRADMSTGGGAGWCRPGDPRAPNCTGRLPVTTTSRCDWRTRPGPVGENRVVVSSFRCTSGAPCALLCAWTFQMPYSCGQGTDDQLCRGSPGATGPPGAGRPPGRQSPAATALHAARAHPARRGAVHAVADLLHERAGAPGRGPAIGRAASGCRPVIGDRALGRGRGCLRVGRLERGRGEPRRPARAHAGPDGRPAGDLQLHRA